jgi:head-tail adaptor
MLLPYRVTIQSRSAGAGPVAWSDVVTTWADVRSVPLSTPEGPSASGLRSVTQYFVTLRASHDVDPTQRIQWKGLTLRINGVRPLDKNYTELLCSEEH